MTGVSTVLAGARGFKRHPLAPDPHPRSARAMNVSYDYWKSSITLGRENGGRSVEESADRQQVLARVLALVQHLELLDRQLILAYLEGLDADSMSQITGLSAANVWTRIHRIKNVLVRQFHSGGRDAK